MNGNYFVPSAILNVPARILHCTYKKVNGVNTEVYEPDEDVLWVGAKSYGGTEKNVNDVYTIIDTMEFTCYYTSNIQSSDRLEILTDGSVWEILNTPENIDMRGAFMKIKCRRWHG